MNRNLYLNKNLNFKLACNCFTIITNEQYNIDDVVSVFLKSERNGYVIVQNENINKANRFIAIAKYTIFRKESIEPTLLLKPEFQDKMLQETGLMNDKGIEAITNQISDNNFNPLLERVLYRYTLYLMDNLKIELKDILDKYDRVPKKVLINNRNLMNEMIEFDFLKN